LEAYAGGDIVILRSTKFAPVFMGYYCNTRAIAEQKAARGQGDAVVHISSLALAGVQICVPEIHEQTAIATVLSEMDTEIESLESKLAKAREIKQGMMQELLTGKIRLVKSSAVSANQQEMSYDR
jgi:type I restriction enzyme S subunit